MTDPHIDPSTPMGASLANGGATFRIWAPGAREVYVVRRDFDVSAPTGWRKNPQDLLVKDAGGYWAGFFPGVMDGDEYRFWVVGAGGEGFKRDPYARELAMHGYPDCNCIVRDPADYPWHDQGFRPPLFHERILYQLHIGVFSARDEAGNDLRPGRVSKFLDVVERIPYLADLGINAIMPLPFVEFQGENSLGYNGTDLFSPEMDYAVDAVDLAPYLRRVNGMLAEHGFPPLTARDLTGQINQLKALIDLCHLHGIAVIADVVYNHAGGNFDDQSLHFLDRPASTDNRDSIYFLPDGHAGGLVFAFWKREVRQFLIDNARMFLDEYHIDGLRYDQVTVIDEHGGWSFCQDLSATVRFVSPRALQIAEYWGNERWRGAASPPDGMGFDAGYDDRLRDRIRDVIRAASGGAGAAVHLDPLRDALSSTAGFPAAWKVFQCIENHDLIDASHTGNDRQPRIAVLADPSNSRSWFARSRARVATGLLLTAPGMPMLFMGQEFLEDKPWTDNPHAANLMIWWAGLEGLDRHMADFHRFTRDLIRLRRKHPALHGEAIDVFHVHDDNRVIAYHRWLPGVGRDVVVVASLSERSFEDRSYRLGFPADGEWREVFNSDVYDEFPNPAVRGNAGGIVASGPGLHGLPSAAGVTLPANGILVFARDLGDP